MSSAAEKERYWHERRVQKRLAQIKRESKARRFTQEELDELYKEAAVLVGLDDAARAARVETHVLSTGQSLSADDESIDWQVRYEAERRHFDLKRAALEATLVDAKGVKGRRRVGGSKKARKDAP